MKILVLADGSSSHTERYVAELRRQEVQVTLASLQDGPSVDTTFKSSALGNFASYRALHTQLSDLVDETQPDVINSHFASAYGYSASRLRSVLHDRRILWALHLWGSDILVSPKKSVLHRLRVEKALTSADIIFGDSEHLLNTAKRFGAQNTHCRIWGPDETVFASESQLKEHAKWKVNEPVKVIAPRRHESIYRNDLILEALVDPIKAKQVSLITTESGSGFKGFMKRARELEVDGLIDAYSGLSHAEYIDKLRSQHLLISASKTDSSPVSVLEAQAVGVIPIVIQFDGVGQMFDMVDRVRCVIADVSANELMQAVGSMIALPEKEREWTIMRNFARVMSLGSYETNISATINDLRQALRSIGKS